MQAHFFAESIVEIADEACEGAGLIDRSAFEQQRKSRIEARKWHASKTMPRLNGDNKTVELSVNLPPERMTDSQLAAIAAKAGIVIDGELSESADSD